MSLRNRITQAEEQAQMRAEYYAMEDRVAALEDERDRLREGHRLIKCFAEHIRDNAGNANLVRVRAGNIISWIDINAALQEDRDD